MTYPAPLIVLTAMTFYAGRRIDPAVYLMLDKVISPVGKIASDILLVLIARFELFFMRVTVGAE
ncbi:MAG: hypothetical protein A2010_12005 [Nitrospirae bacterium GWD2_57_9]|nr:MAG: hypothetical protein A2010_12005 [Nitrospirae bacterium GWD2_57_9]OGW46129.1 MAG: hypothetical protein A2078_12190 [Nitrospirae bacterium GWC2_57_9]